LRLLIDLDGVVADFTLGFSSLATDMGLVTKPWTTNQQESWDYSFSVNEVWAELKSRWNWWMTLPPLINDHEVRLLNEVIASNNVYFVTNRPATRGYSAEMQSRLWLGSIGVQADHASVIATRSGTKGVLAKSLNLELAIDDKPSNLEEIALQGVGVVKRNWKYNSDSPFIGVSKLEDFLTSFVLERC
jgi:hypothetical protein